MFSLIWGMPWYLILFAGFIIGLLYYVIGVGILLWMDTLFVWFAERMAARGSFFGAMLLICLWPLTVCGFCLSHWYKVLRHGADPYAPKAA